MSFDPDDLFFMVPRRFGDARAEGQINGRQFLLGFYLVTAAHFKTGKVAQTLRAIADGCDWQWSRDTLTRDLQVLRPAWIDFEEPGQGQRQPYVIRLTGLRRTSLPLAEVEEPRNPASEEGSSDSQLPQSGGPAEVSSSLRKLWDAANPHGESDSTLSDSPPCGSHKKRREEKQTCNEERLDHLGVENTEPASSNERRSDDEIAELGVLSLGELLDLNRKGAL